MTEHSEDDMTSHAAAGNGTDDPGVEPIAVIGLACRLPGAGSAAQYWENLVNGVESVRFFTREEQLAAGVPEWEVDDPAFVPAAPALDDVDGFDAALFGMSRREAELRDPQQRLFLELAHTAFEDAGYDPARYPGDIGVYGGIGADEYQWHYLRHNPAIMSSSGLMSVATASHPDYLATLVSYKLNLRGPSLTVHTACSTTLVAFHLACEALRNGECDMALTGGASIEIPLNRGYVHADGGVLSPDGHTRTFDAAAAGTVWGNGGGAVILKRLSDALADGDHVRAVVRGSAINNDGANKVGFSAPSMEGQAAVIAQALGVAGVDPRTITYVEAHGTATALGDPIEVAALSSAYGQHTADTGWCGLGSVKTNIGHLGPAAGIAAVIKTVLALEHGLLPPSLHFERPNPKLGLADSPFYVNATLSKWNPECGIRRAGVSSFGIGGSNGHAILEQAPEPVRPGGQQRPVHLLQLSARTGTALDTLAARLADHLADHPDLDLADVSYTLRVGRAAHPHRAAVVARDSAEAVAALRERKRRVTGSATGRVPGVAFLFSGQGAQYAGMGAELYRAEPVFRRAVDDCLAALPADLAADLRALLVEAADLDTEAREAANTRLAQTAYTQPALFVVEYALARLWLSWGVRPAGMIGHSIGEYVAATLAGVFTLADAVSLVVARGRLMQSLPAGSMLAVQLEESDLAARLPDGLSIATINGPRACVVAGPGALVEEFAAELKAAGVGRKALRTSHAFHSSMMEPILGEFRDLVAAVPRRAPQTPFLSNVTGRWISAEDATDPSYWTRHLRGTVRFGDCVATLLSDGDWLLVECGPGKQLAGLARMQVPKGAVPPLTSLPAPGEKHGDLDVVYGTAGRLWTCGVALDVETFAAPARRVPLVPYPYERKRYWVDPVATDAAMGAAPPRRGPRPVDEWFSVPVWRQVLPAGADSPPRRCLAFVAGPAGKAVVAGLRAAAVETVEIVPGPGYGRQPDGRYTVRVGERADYDALLAELGTTEPDQPPASGAAAMRIVHCWALDASPAAGRAEDAWQAQDQGFFSLLYLVQAAAAAQLNVQLDVLTAGTQDVVGGDATRPEHATVAGIARVVPLETTAVQVRHLDLPDRVDAGLVAAVVAELRREPVQRVVALRGGRRWVQEYEAQPVPAGDSTAGLRPGGVYLITGGLGGLGITLAEDLAQRVRAKLVLLARSGLPERAEWDTYLQINGTADRAGRAIAAIRRMEQAGAEVLVLAADVTSGDELRAVRRQALDRFGRIDGIIHSAGVPGGGMAEVKDRAVAEQVLAPKIRGTLELARVFGHLPLDFVALFSSVTAVAGGFGQVDYCAANNFLDAYARSEHGWSTPVTSLNWGGWLEVGMAAEVAAPEAFRALQRGDRITPIEHPVITARHVTDEVVDWASGVVAPSSHWVLDEHRISGIPVMPGTGHLENVRCAFAAVAGPPPPGRMVELRDVVFVDPMAVDDAGAAEVRVAFADGTDGLDFQVASVVAGTTTVHVRGSVGWVDPGPAPAVDLGALQARCRLASHDVARDGDRSHSGLLTFGPRWSSLRQVRVGQDEEVALLEAGETVAAELDRWVLHPALLDEATSFGRSITGGQYLPLGYGRLVVRAPLPARLYSHLRYRGGASSEVVAADLSLYDEHGREVVAIGDFMLRRIDPAAVTGTLTSAGATAAAPAVASTETGISPTDGAEAFRRVLGGQLGRQVVITAQPLARVFAGVEGLTQETVAGDLGTVAVSAAEEAGDREGYQAPRTELEVTLASVWGAVLGVDSVGVEDDFFELGGNSLIAVQLISQIRKTVGVKLPMRSLFETPSVAGMAAVIEGLRATEQAAPAPERAIPRLPRERAGGSVPEPRPAS